MFHYIRNTSSSFKVTCSCAAADKQSVSDNWLSCLTYLDVMNLSILAQYI